MSMAGIAQGSQPLISYYFGQKSYEKCKKLLRYGLAATLVLSILSLLVCFGGAKWIVALFVSKELTELRAYSVHVFMIFSISYLVVGYNVVIGGYFTAVEQPVQAIVISIARGFVTLFISLFVMTRLFGGEGIWWSATVSEALCLVLTLIFLILYRP